jgi:uncharacterized membrane protein
MDIVANIIGGLLVLFWLVHIPIGRRTARAHGGLMYATVFQFNVLPLIVAIGLFLSGNLLHLIVGAVTWILAIRFSTFFMFVYPLVTGWVYGGIILSRYHTDSAVWYYSGAALGALTMFVVCSIVVAIILGDWEHRERAQEEAEQTHPLDSE